MKELYEKSMQIIKVLNITDEKEYNSLMNNCFILTAESLKYVCGTRDFNEIVKIAEKVN